MLAHRGHGEYDAGKLTGASCPQWLAWVLGTATGLILAPSSAFIHTYGLDTALPAFFMVLAIEEMRRSRRALAAGLLGAAITAFVLLAAQPGVALLCATAAAGIALLPHRHGTPAPSAAPASPAAPPPPAAPVTTAALPAVTAPPAAPKPAPRSPPRRRDDMRLWISAAIVTIASWLLKASGPLAIGERQLPARLIDVSALVAPALLGGLLMDKLGGVHWATANWQQAAGVGVAGLACLARMPMLVAVVLGVAATVALRLWA